MAIIKLNRERVQQGVSRDFLHREFEKVFNRFKDNRIEKLKEIVDSWAEETYQKILDNLSYTDISPEELKELAPYSTKAFTPAHPPHVHEVTGTLKNAVKLDIDPSTGDIFLFVDMNEAPYAKFVHDGTSRMIPRPFFTSVLFEQIPVLEQEIQKELNLKDFKIQVL